MLSNPTTCRSWGKLCWLDLRGTGLSVLERLCLEECLLQKETSRRNWLIVGCHEPVHHRYMVRNNINKTHNPSAVIVMGMGGKPQSLLNLELVQKDQVLAFKRFSGGGTVVLDYDSIWVTLIGREKSDGRHPQHYPRPIMDWTAQALYTPMFEELGCMQQRAQNNTSQQQATTLVLDTKSCSPDNSGRTVQKAVPVNEESSADVPPAFSLRENDYVLGDRKIGGNAQSIGKAGWLHHTSFLWDYQQDNMDYLTLPAKRPEYRASRTHDDFLVRIKEEYPNLSKRDFFTALQTTARRNFEVESISAREGISIVNSHGGFDKWLEEHSRIKTVLGNAL